MKRIIYKLIFCLSVLSFASCVSDNIEQEVMVDNDAITLQLYTGANSSRAVVADEAHEYALSHLDVFIFDNDGSKFHYERIATTDDASNGKVTLSGKTKSDFKQQALYWVYVVANSSKTESEMNSVQSLDALNALIQTDVNIHLSGLDLDNVPKYFLMDGIAYKGESEPTPAGTIEINDGSSVGTTVLKVNLRRAAAKVKVVLTAGEKVVFFKNYDVGYYLRNMPTVTSLLAGSSSTEKGLVDTDKTASAYSKGKYKDQTYNGEVYNGNGELTIIAYVYAHDWSNATNPWEQQTNLVVNIPVYYDTDITGEIHRVTYEQSYYQIELGKDHKFERNHYYLITGKINAPGAEEFTEPIELQNMKYSAMDWKEVEVEVGGETKPTYLKVNKDTLRIYNQNIDESLVFASSSPITLGIEDKNNMPTPYYINKFGVETYVNPNTNNIGAIDLTKGGLAGNIQVKSDIPQNNAVRYFTLVVSNEDGLSETVFVEQYPVIYITNVLGYYSYRSDFKLGNGNVTTWEDPNDPYYTHVSWSRNQWSYGSGYPYGTPFFRSKVNYKTETSGNNRGKSDLDYYYWDGREIRRYDYKSSSSGNARMYHVHVTATSGDYTVGRPRMNTDGFTDSGADNAKLVSPSFMVASQLGATQNPNNYDQAATHCNQYVETYRVTEDGEEKVKIFDDWRLPTAAEIAIIIDNQYLANSAMDEVLAGHYYYSASGEIENPKAKEQDNKTFVRCVRDAYVK